jgi:hypothetical protein
MKPTINFEKFEEEGGNLMDGWACSKCTINMFAIITIILC